MVERAIPAEPPTAEERATGLETPKEHERAKLSERTK